ncbi:MAG: acetate--CoA ligase family protein [Panacagrimonas sp.]
MSEIQPLAPERTSIDRLFAPRSIALVGATERSIWSIAAYDNLKRCGFEGRIDLVNPKGGSIFGRVAATSCAAVGEEIDAALLMVPESKMLEVFEDLKAAHVGGAVILSAGFAETGAAGAERQKQLTAVARAADIRIMGPNCLGFANFSAKTAIWTTQLRRPMPGAHIAIVSQSGALAAQLEQFAYQQRVGLTHMISTGNEADINVADAIEYLARQAEPRAIALFLESVRDPSHFERAVAAANAAGKPVVVLKVGASEATARAAQAHTGSLVGNDRVFDALCRRLGLSRVRSLEELIVTTDLFARLGPVANKGLALVAMSGGLCEIATDQAEAEGVPIPVFALETLSALRDALPPLATPANPLDITGAVMLEPALIARSLAAVVNDPGVGVVGFVFDAPVTEDKRGFARSFMTQVAAGFEASGKPSFMMSHTFSAVSGEARAMTDELRIVYSGGGVRHCLNALGHLFRRSHEPLLSAALLDSPSPGAPRHPLPAGEGSRSPLPEGEGLGGRESLTSRSRPSTEREVLAHLSAHGVPVVPARIVCSRDEAIAAARTLDSMVVLKIASPDIPHKTEVGGVALNLLGDEAVGQAYDAMIARVTSAKPDANIEGVIVSPMRDKGVEMFVGTMRDPQWGAAIAVGLGGVWVEALKDTSLRLLPISERDVLEMLTELRGAVLLDGFRGAPPVDRQELARAIVAIGQAALALGPELVALEVNPLLASGKLIEALDGLTVWGRDDAHT